MAVALGWRPELVGIPVTVVSVALGSAAFVSLALLLAGSLRAEAVLALANLVWVLLAGVGGLLLPATLLPAPLTEVVRWLPSGALGDALRAGLLDGDVPWLPWLVLVGWTVLLGAAAARLFRWDD